VCEALAKPVALQEGGVGVKLIMISRKPSKTRDISDIDGSTTRGNNVTEFEIFEPLGFRIDECPAHFIPIKTIICFSYA
jgi:hypothetical protein